MARSTSSTRRGGICREPSVCTAGFDRFAHVMAAGEDFQPVPDLASCDRVPAIPFGKGVGVV
jgi:hypothetical protein